MRSILILPERPLRVLQRSLIAPAVLAGLLTASPSLTAAVDPFMGEYAGKYAVGREKPADAEGRIVPEGDGLYRAVLTAGSVSIEFHGRAAGNTLAFSREPDEGCIGAWSAAGPYRFEGKGGYELLDTVFPPEEEGMPGVEWRPLKNDPARPCVADLAAGIGGEDCAAYLKARIDSPKSQEADLLLGSDNGIKAWLNGRLVFSGNAMRAMAIGQDRARVNLSQGGNVLMLKLTQDGYSWTAGAALKPAGGGKLAGVLGPGEGTAGWTVVLKGGALSARAEGGSEASFSLKRRERVSPTLGQKPPKGAIVLLPFADDRLPSLAEWENGAWKTYPDGSMEAGNGDNRTRRSFGDLKLHVEFMIPYQPGTERDRGNSGVYLMDRYEIQVLETFGLAPDPGICGAIYRVAAPKVNATLPPLAWQTYDVTFRAPRFKTDGTVARPALITVLHNGVMVHDSVEVTNQTGGGAEGAAATGPIKLQDHGHPVRFRNIWVLELRDGS